MMVFRFPNDRKFYTLDEHFDVFPVSFHGFIPTEVLRLKGKITEISVEEIQNLNFQLPQNPPQSSEDETKEAYLRKIEKSISTLHQHHLEKMVIARRKDFHFQKLNAQQTFFNLCEKYPSAFVYAFSENNCSWIGAFAEVLGKFNKKTSQFQTMSLAGTLPLDEEWSEKELKEQQTVTEYILETLKKYNSEVQVSDLHDYISGNIKHLKTDFSLKIEADRLSQLLEDLHPTPAVCGYPKNLCKTLISEIENFPREMYAGYSKIETEDEITCFVTLRCGRFYENKATLYAGGGITALSKPEKEWQETELKLQALGSNLSFV